MGKLFQMICRGSSRGPFAAKECKDKNYYPSHEVNAEDGHQGLIAFDVPNWYKQELEPVNI